MMPVHFMSGSEAAERIENIIHANTQVGEDGVYLTVKSIHILRKKGSLDFSGKEQQIKDKGTLSPEKKCPDDKYGWWHLSEGSYLVSFNEQLGLKDGEAAILQPREELLQNGCYHPIRIFSGEEKLTFLPLQVGSGGIDIKENARISLVKMIRR